MAGLGMHDSEGAALRPVTSIDQERWQTLFFLGWRICKAGLKFCKYWVKQGTKYGCGFLSMQLHAVQKRV